jgi:hypothetical protein
LNRLVDFNEIWYTVNAIQGDLDSIVFNPLSSANLKWFRLKVACWQHDFQPYTAMVWDCLIVRLLWLHHIQSLSNVTVATITTGKVDKLFFFFGSYICELE